LTQVSRTAQRRGESLAPPNASDEDDASQALPAFKPGVLVQCRLSPTLKRIYGDIEMPKKQSSDKTSSLAGKVLSGSKKPTPSDAKSLAGSVLAQDEKKGKRKK
jgi:hypothetical protein